MGERIADSIIVKGMQAVVLPLQGLDKYINTIKLVNKEHGKNLLPWEERYLNYRVSLLGLTNQKLSIEALKLLNTQDDIVPSSSWSRLMSAPERFSDTANLLCIWNNWGPLEDWGGRRFRWVNNDAELLLFSPSEETRSLILELERGPSLPPAGATVIAYVNGAPSDTATITGFHRAMMRLPDVLQKENLVRLHVTAEGKPSENDPRVLNFRVFRISLSDN